MTEHEDLIARLRNRSGVQTADVNERVALMDEAADVLEKVTAQRKELAEKHRRVEKFLRMEREAGREQQVRAESAERRIEKVREMHRPIDIEPSDTICGECSLQLPNGHFFGKVVEWPCETVKALAEGDER